MSLLSRVDGFRLGLLSVIVFVVTPFTHSASLSIRMVGPDGSALDGAQFSYITDMELRPVARIGTAGPVHTLDGLPDVPVQLAMIVLDVPEYGKLNFTAGNGGRGFVPNGQTLDALLEVARHRSLVCLELSQRASTDGFEVPSAVSKAIAEATEFVKRADAAAGGSAAQAKLAMEAIKLIAPASENLVVAIGRNRLNRQGKLSKDKLISTFALFEPREGKKWRDAAAPLFNCAVVNWRWQKSVRPDFTTDFSRDPYRPNDALAHVLAMGMRVRGVTGMWLNLLPTWLKSVNEEKLHKIHTVYARDIAARYPEVGYWQAVSEAEGSWDNLGFLEPNQIVDLSTSVLKQYSAVAPEVKIGVNSVLPWGEDAAAHLRTSPCGISPYAFHAALATAGASYDFIVLQLYFNGWDLFEVDRMLDTFGKLGKRIHIESQTASRPEPMPQSYSFPDGHPAVRTYLWHRPWDEDLQADWLEQMFIVCLSKSYVDEWNWWDLADYDNCYYPWGGLLDADYEPKESYRRLEDLVERWVN